MHVGDRRTQRAAKLCGIGDHKIPNGDSARGAGL
jgi:hypothetical protein